MVRVFLCFLLGTVLMLTLGCGQQAGTTVTAPPRPTMKADLRLGVHTLTMERYKLPTIHYTISIPAGYFESQEKVPLVIALHYSGDNKPSIGKVFLEELIGPGLEE